jgi:hypothetical protein
MNDIQKPEPKAPEKIKRRPGLGVSVMRGLLVLSRLSRHYWTTGYLPVLEVRGDDRRDLRRAMRYIERLGSWKFWKVMGRRKKK